MAWNGGRRRLRPRHRLLLSRGRFYLTTLFEEGLQLGNRLQVLRAASCALEFDEFFQRDEPAAYAEDFHLLRGGEKFFIRATARHFAKQIEVTKASCESKVQPIL